MVFLAAAGFLVSKSAILELKRLQITGMRSTESYRIINFIPVTHIASEGDTHDWVCVCFSFESIIFDGITKWFSLFLSTFHFVYFGGFQVKRNPKIIITVNCVKRKKEKKIKIHKIICTHNGKIEVRNHNWEWNCCSCICLFFRITFFCERKPENT